MRIDVPSGMLTMPAAGQGIEPVVARRVVGGDSPPADEYTATPMFPDWAVIPMLTDVTVATPPTFRKYIVQVVVTGAIGPPVSWLGNIVSGGRAPAPPIPAAGVVPSGNEPVAMMASTDRMRSSRVSALRPPAVDVSVASCWAVAGISLARLPRWRRGALTFSREPFAVGWCTRRLRTAARRYVTAGSWRPLPSRLPVLVARQASISASSASVTSSIGRRFAAAGNRGLAVSPRFCIVWVFRPQVAALRFGLERHGPSSASTRVTIEAGSGPVNVKR